MERGASASNLKMRFNLAAVRKGTVQLSKKLEGVHESDIMAEFPYQIWYKTTNGGEEKRLTNAIPNSSIQNTDYVFYKDSVNPVKYQQSVTIDGTVYQDVFFLKHGETADISFPGLELEEGEEIVYRIVECGVNTEVFSSVSVNNEAIEGTAVPGAEHRKDFGIAYATTDARPKVNYVNTVNPEALRSLTITKRLYHEDGTTVISASDDNTEFTFRLYLASEHDVLDVANMQTYHVKDPSGCYCSWDVAAQKFAKIGEGITDYTQLTEEQKASASFTTSIYGTISRIPTGYTVEIRDVLAGTLYRVEERPWEIPDGYSFQKYDGYDTENASVVESGTSGVFGVNGTIVSGKDAPVIVCNLKGWGLRVNKIWRDKDYMSAREAAYFALFTRDGSNELVLVPDSVRQLPYSANPQSIYWYYDHLPVSGTTGVADYLIREVQLTGNGIVIDGAGVVSGYDSLAPIGDGEPIILHGTQKGEDTESQFNYTVHYEEGAISQETNVRVDTVTNERPGIILKKQDWNGNDLSGAVFELKEGDNLIGTFTSDAEGLITTAFLGNEKDYTLTEIQSPYGYHGLETAMTIRVAIDGTVTVSGPDGAYYTLTQAQGSALATLVIKNRPFSLQAVKQDGDTEKLLEGVVFALHRQRTVDGVTTIDLKPMTGYEELVTDENGIIPRIDGSLPAGTYQLREKVPLSGYGVLPGYIDFSLSETGAMSLLSTPDWVSLSNSILEDGTIAYTITVLNYIDASVTLLKVDDRDQALLGAKFRLCKFGTTWEVVSPYGDIDLTAESEITLQGLSVGRYRLEETKTPNGYVTLQKFIYFNISQDGTAALTDENGTGDNTNSNVRINDNVITVSNIPGAALPNTGGPGTKRLGLLGLLLIVLACIGLTIRKSQMLLPSSAGCEGYGPAAVGSHGGRQKPERRRSPGMMDRIIVPRCRGQSPPLRGSQECADGA